MRDRRGHDGLRRGRADHRLGSSTSFQTGETAIGARSFLGNAITYPAGGKIGENVLVGTKTMIPIDGELRHDVGLLGSPAFEIPRSHNSEGRKDLSRKQFRRRLTAKNRHNIGTMAIFLALNLVRTYVTFLLGFTTVDLYQPYGIWALAAGTVVAAVFNFFFSVVVERASDRLPPAAAAVLLDLRAVLLVARTVLEAQHPGGRVQRDAVQGDDVADARCAHR